MRLQLIIELIMHGTSLTPISLSSFSISQFAGKVKPQKKMGEKLSFVVCIRICITMFSAFKKQTTTSQNETNNKPPKHTKWALYLKEQPNKKYKSNFLR